MVYFWWYWIIKYTTLIIANIVFNAKYAYYLYSYSYSLIYFIKDLIYQLEWINLLSLHFALLIFTFYIFRSNWFFLLYWKCLTFSLDPLAKILISFLNVLLKVFLFIFRWVILPIFFLIEVLKIIIVSLSFVLYMH